MNESLFLNLSDQDLLNLALRIIDEYMALHQTYDQKAITKKRNELFEIYKMIKDRGLIFESKKTN